MTSFVLICETGFCYSSRSFHSSTRGELELISFPPASPAHLELFKLDNHDEARSQLNNLSSKGLGGVRQATVITDS